MKTRAAPGPQGRPRPGLHSPREQTPLTPSASRLGHGLARGQRDAVKEACGFRGCRQPGRKQEASLLFLRFQGHGGRGLFLLLFGNRRLTRSLGGFSAETVVLMLSPVFLLEATGLSPARVTRGVLLLPPVIAALFCTSVDAVHSCCAFKGSLHLPATPHPVPEAGQAP